MVNLRDKFFGCIAASHIGSAMAAPVEGWSYQKIEQEYGTLDRFLPYHHYQNTTSWVREPGTTEDGIERQKLMITAIIEKKDRVTAEDIRRIWVRDIKPEAPGVVSEPFEGELLKLAKTRIPARDLGKYCDYSGLVSLARSCHPIGLINAGDPRGAVDDIYEVGQLYLSPNSRGIQWAAVTAVAIAAATRPGATVDSVLQAVHEYCRVDNPFIQDAAVLAEIDRGLELTRNCRDFRQLRRAFDEVYSGEGIPYAYSYANEVVTKAICIFRMTQGDPRQAVIAGVNMGRDTDCTTAVAAGIAGALSGGGTLPREWIEEVDRATRLNPHTNSQRTIAEHADGLFEAYLSRLRRAKEYIQTMAPEL